MFIAVFVRRLRPGKTYDDFIAAWYPDEGFGFPGRGPFVACNLEDERELLTSRRRFGASTRSRPSSW